MPRVASYLTISSIQNTPSDLNIKLEDLYKQLHTQQNQKGLKTKIANFISNTLVSLGLKNSAAKNTIKQIKGKFTEKYLGESYNNSQNLHK